MKIVTLSLSLLCLSLACNRVDSTPIIYRSPHYTVYSNAVYEKNDRAIATSSHTLTSTYRKVNIPTTYNAYRNFEQQGYYINSEGDTVYQTDLDHTDGFDTTVWAQPQTESALVVGAWQQVGNLGAYPTYHSDQLLVDALYNMALDELSTYEKWRDAGLAIYMALAYIAPDASMGSLRAQVNSQGLLYDRDNALSTSHLAWGIAAWELYQFTGDTDWLAYAYEVLSQTAHAYTLVAYDPHMQLMRGYMPHLDKGELCYPEWMQAADRFQSLSLATNVLYCEMYDVLAQMATALDKEARTYEAQHELLKAAINYRLWLPHRGHYAPFLYGDANPIPAYSSDNLGQSLAILFGITPLEQRATIVSHTPITTYGTPSHYPTPSHTAPYFSPYVQALWSMAAAKADNQIAVVQGIAALYRSTALAATHKGILPTATTQAAHLGGIAGNIATIYRLYYGMQFTTEGIYFNPYVPPSLGGNKLLANFNYRDATLQIELKGYGNRVEAFTIDDVMQTTPFLPANLKGRHRIEIVLANNSLEQTPTNMVDDAVLPPTSLLSYSNRVEVENYQANSSSLLFINAVEPLTLDTSYYDILPTDTLTTIAISPISPTGRVGFSGRPISLILPSGEQWIEAEAHTIPARHSIVGYRGRGAVRLDATKQNALLLPVTVKEAGTYLIDVRYAPLSYGCALRSLYIDNSRVGTVVMPALVGDVRWGEAASLRVYLPKGQSILSLRYQPLLDSKDAQIDGIRLRRVL